ncbi:out at first protein, partial [Clarias magur]
LFPQIEEIMVQPLRDSRDHYEELKQMDDAMSQVCFGCTEPINSSGLLKVSPDSLKLYPSSLKRKTDPKELHRLPKFMCPSQCVSLTGHHICGTKDKAGAYELKVLVRLSDGLITAETLESDSERDIISVEFRHTDGTLITLLADFKRHVKIVRALVLGEPERGQTHYQGLCFISRLEHGEIIPSEAMVRLRQKNPHLVRTAEEKRGLERMSMNMVVNLTLSWHLSSHIRSMCRDAHDFIYTREQDAKYWREK